MVFSLISAWINGWVNNREADDFRRHRAHYGVIVMLHMVQLRHQQGFAHKNAQDQYDSSRVLQMRALLAARGELAVDYNTLLAVLYVFEHTT